MVGHRKVDEGLPQDGPQSRLVDRPRGVGLEVVHVGEGRRPSLDHLEGRQQRSVVDELGRDVLPLRREDVLGQPLLERQVVGDSAQERHGGVRVRVDEAGHHDVAAGVDGGASRVALR